MRIRILALALSCACTYAEEKAGVFLEVANVPSAADGLVVTVTDSLGNIKTYKPAFPPQSLDGGPLEMAFAAPAQNGTVTAAVVAMLKDQQLAQGSVSGTYTAPTDLHLQLTLGAASTGTYAVKCNANATCSALPLECKNYGNSGEIGVCTKTCSSAADCTGTTPAATCVPFLATTTSYCQWDCTATGSLCPPGLLCKPAGTTAKSYCTGM
jgi:hypothetical protein